MREAPRAPDSIADFFRSAGTLRRFPRQSYLFHEDSTPTAVYFVTAGMLSIDRTTAAGRRVLFDVATPGDVIGELAVIDTSRRSGTAATLVDSELIVVAADDFRHHVRTDVEFANRMLESVAIRLRELSDQFVEATSAGAAARIAARLIKLTETQSNDDAPIELRLPFSQEELAQWAGLSREGGVKGLAALRSANLIETSRRRVVITDPVGLARAAAANAR